MDEVVLRIGDTVFKAKKELLCEYSDYFRAMFSGFYVESKKQEINIDVSNLYVCTSLTKVPNYVLNSNLFLRPKLSCICPLIMLLTLFIYLFIFVLHLLVLP